MERRGNYCVQHRAPLAVRTGGRKMERRKPDMVCRVYCMCVYASGGGPRSVAMCRRGEGGPLFRFAWRGRISWPSRGGEAEAEAVTHPALLKKKPFSSSSMNKAAPALLSPHSFFSRSLFLPSRPPPPPARGVNVRCCFWKRYISQLTKSEE